MAGGYIGTAPATRDPTVADDSVTTAKIQNNAVTGTKIAMTSDAAGDILTYTGTDYARLAIGAAGKVLKVASGGTAVEWATDTGGTGDVVGPGSSTDNALARFDTTTGKLLQNSTATLTDAGTLSATAIIGTQVDITAQGDLRLQDTTGGEYVALQAPGTVASSWTLTLPTDDGTASQFLQTDGSGVTTWATVTTNTSGAWTSGTSTTGKALVMGF